MQGVRKFRLGYGGQPRGLGLANKMAAIDVDNIMAFGSPDKLIHHFSRFNAHQLL